jgi:hypothetical protein
MNKMREIIAWKKQGWGREAQYGSEWSLDNGIFGRAWAALTYQDEAPAVLTGYSDHTPLDQVGIATEQQRERYLNLVAQIESLRAQLKMTEKDIVENGVPMTWDWIIAHGKPREDGSIPEPYQHKKELVNLRKGSRVALATVSSAYSRIQSQVGKVVKKRKRGVIVAFRSGTYRIPYRDLKPAREVSLAERKKNEKSAEMLAKVAGDFNKIAGEILK